VEDRQLSVEKVDPVGSLILYGVYRSVRWLQRPFAGFVLLAPGSSRAGSYCVVGGLTVGAAAIYWIKSGQARA
jgi:hypothetical protein